MLFQQSVNKIKIIKMCIYLIVLALIFKVGYIQIIDRKNIYDKALESWQRSFPVQANRGKIYDRSENVLATDLTTASLVVVPSQIKDQATTALELSKILNLDVNVLKEKLNKKVSIQRISPEGRQLDNQVASKIQRLHLSGVYLIKDTKRYYPGNNYLSHCLGFVGIDNQGLLGLELEYDSFLKGKNGSIDYYMDAKSHNLKMYPSHYTYSQSGMNITLTIDKRVQDVIERELSNAYDTYHPDGIWALAMNPKNGEILGIASYPNFNPNDYQNEDKDIYNQNIPIWKTYEPSIQDHVTPPSPEGLLLGGVNVLEHKQEAYQASPLPYIKKDVNTPSILMIHGNKDRLVPFGQSVLLYNTLKENNKDVTFYCVEHADHGGAAFWNNQVLDNF